MNGEEAPRRLLDKRDRLIGLLAKGVGGLTAAEQLEAIAVYQELNAAAYPGSPYGGCPHGFAGRPYCPTCAAEDKREREEGPLLEQRDQLRADNLRLTRELGEARGEVADLRDQIVSAETTRMQREHKRRTRTERARHLFRQRTD